VAKKKESYLKKVKNNRVSRGGSRVFKHFRLFCTSPSQNGESVWAKIRGEFHGIPELQGPKPGMSVLEQSRSEKGGPRRPQATVTKKVKNERAVEKSDTNTTHRHNKKRAGRDQGKPVATGKRKREGAYLHVESNRRRHKAGNPRKRSVGVGGRHKKGNKEKKETSHMQERSGLSCDKTRGRENPKEQSNSGGICEKSKQHSWGKKFRATVRVHTTARVWGEGKNSTLSRNDGEKKKKERTKTTGKKGVVGGGGDRKWQWSFREQTLVSEKGVYLHQEEESATLSRTRPPTPIHIARTSP